MLRELSMKYERKAQTSTYLKPILIIIFAVLFVLIIQNLLEFQLGLREDTQQFEIHQESREIVRDLLECLSVEERDSPLKNVVNQTKIEEFEMKYAQGQPECAQNFKYGYNAEIIPHFDYIETEITYDEPMDVVFAIDDSQSMEPYIEGIRDNIEHFMEHLPEGSKVGMYTWNGPYNYYMDLRNDELPDEYDEEDPWNWFKYYRDDYGNIESDPENIDNYINEEYIVELQPLDPGIEKIRDNLEPLTKDNTGGFEPADVAIRYAIDEINWRDDVRRVLVTVGDECANKTEEDIIKRNEEGNIKIDLINWSNWDVIQDSDYYEGRDWDHVTYISNDKLPETTIEMAQEAADNDIEIHALRHPDDMNDGLPWDDIASITGGESYDIQSDFQTILEEIADQTGTLPGPTTCTLPAQKEYHGDQQIVFLGSTGNNLWVDWEGHTAAPGMMCGELPNELERISSKGGNINTSIYGLGKDSDYDDSITEEDQGGPMFDHAVHGPFFDYTDTGMSGNPYMPDCIDYSRDDTKNRFNASESELGKGITDWNLENIDLQYDPDTDHGLSAWAVGTQWILENHNWEQEKDKQIFVVGNDYPTGGGHAENDLSKDKDIVDTVIETAHEKNVTIHTVSREWRNSEIDETDARLYMEQVATGTGGEFFKNGHVIEITEKIRGLFGSETTSDTCGDRNSFSIGKSVDRPTITTNFPININLDIGMQTIGNLRVNIYDSSLERLAGAINQVVRQGETQNDVIETTFSFGTEETLELVGDYQHETAEKTEYNIHNPLTGEDELEIDGEFIMGINAKKILQERSETGSTIIDFDDEKNRFEAYRGANIQLIAVNHGGRYNYVSPIVLECKNVDCGEQEFAPEINFTRGDDGYMNRGVFFYDFNQIEIGKTETEAKSAVCTPDRDDCTTIHTSDIQTTTIQPGTHQLNIRYDPDQEKVFVD